MEILKQCDTRVDETTVKVAEGSFMGRTVLLYMYELMPGAPHLAGYIHVADSHPWNSDGPKDGDEDDYPGCFYPSIPVHGGCTFNEYLVKSDERYPFPGRWVGFDMGHGCDQERNRDLARPGTLFYNQRIQEGINECKEMCRAYKKALQEVA